YKSLRKLYVPVLDGVTIRDGSKFLQVVGSFPSLKTLSLKFSNFTGTVNGQAFTSLKRLSIQNGIVDGALGDDDEGKF
ncbi:hypothetical protein CUMW_250810, partial [Citrus unshiu]